MQVIENIGEQVIFTTDKKFPSRRCSKPFLPLTITDNVFFCSVLKITILLPFLVRWFLNNISFLCVIEIVKTLSTFI